MKYKVTDTQLANIADAIRTKTGNNSMLEFPNDFVNAINGITPKIKTEGDESRTINVGSTITVHGGEYVRLGSVLVPADTGPLKSVTYSQEPYGTGSLSYFLRFVSGNYNLYAYNSSSSGTKYISSGTIITCKFYKYVAYI